MATAPHMHDQQKFYNHLRMHPGAHQAAQTFAKKIVAQDPQAVAALRKLAAEAGHDERAANALRIVAVTVKFENASSPMFAGGLPQMSGKIVKLALSPAAWLLANSGRFFHWTGSQLQHLSHAI